MSDLRAAERSHRQALSMQRHHTLQLHSGCGSVKPDSGKEACVERATLPFMLALAFGFKLDVSEECK